jgi:hypothetical protein
MITDRDLDLLKQAVTELVKLKSAAAGSTGFRDRLYASALEEWADHLGLDPHQLDKLVLMRQAVSEHCLQ